MTAEQVKSFLYKAEAAVQKAVICYVVINFKDPFIKKDYWVSIGKLITEKGEEYKIGARFYDYKGEFSLIKDDKILNTTPWISYKDSFMEDKFEKWNDIIVSNPFEYYEVESNE